MLLLNVYPMLLQGAGDYDLSWYTIDGGGGTGSGGTFDLSGTIGQPDAATGSTGSFKVQGGFWPGACICTVDMSDLMIVARDWLQSGSDLAGDVDHSGHVDLLDFSKIVSYWLNYCPDDWPL